MSTVQVGNELSTRAFWALPAAERATTFAQLRAEAPVSYHGPPEFGTVPATQGYWAVTRFDDVVSVSRQPEIFCSGQGVQFEEIPIELLEMASSFLVMDAPRHTVLRRVVSGAFTPRRIAELDEAITRRAGEIVRNFIDGGGGDVVLDLAMHLPLWTISTMMGVPDSMRDEMYRAAEALVASQDPDFVPEGTDAMTMQVQSAMTLAGLASELAAARRAEPTTDLISALVHSDAEDDGLSDQMIGSIFLLFAVAGNDTTRNSTSHGIKLLSDHPDQWAAVRTDPANRINPLVEEIVRYATPVIQFRRTATQDVELGSQPIAEGDHVVVFYESANKDESAFPDAARFDSRRDPNHHVGFGGGGPHFCLGANLARAQLRALFGHLAAAGVDIDAGEPSYLASHFINGINRMPVTVAPGT